jgi:hypothetical protein
MIFGVLKVARCHGQELTGDQAVRFRDVLETYSLGKANVRIDDRFGRKPMHRAVLETEDVADKMESADLATAVGEQLVTPHGAFDDLIYVFRWLGFAKDLSASAISEFGQEDWRAGLTIMLAEESWPDGRSGVDVDKHGSPP